MFRIRPDQMQTFDRLARDQFRQRLVAYLRAELPEETSSMSGDALLERVVESEQRAAKYDIRSESGISQWACLTFALGRCFDETPEIRAYLTSTELADTREVRLQHLVEGMDTLLAGPGRGS